MKTITLRWWVEGNEWLIDPLSTSEGEYVRADVARRLLEALGDLIALVELSDEANTPGTDLYTELHVARAAITAAQEGEEMR